MRRQWIGGAVLLGITGIGVALVADFQIRSERAGSEAIPPPLGRAVAFPADVRPILQARCVRCHGPETQKGGLRLDTRDFVLRGGTSGAVVVPGPGADSPLLRRVLGLDDGPIMPPKEDPLDREQIRILRTWIEHGAP